MDQGLERTSTEQGIQLWCRRLERRVRQRRQLIRARRQVPIGTGFPQTSGGHAEIAGVELGQPTQAGLNLVMTGLLQYPVIATRLQVFQHQQNFVITALDKQTTRHRAGVREDRCISALPRIVPIPIDLDPVGLELALMRGIGAPATRMAGWLGQADVLDDHTEVLAAVHLGTKQLAIAAPQRLDDLGPRHRLRADCLCNRGQLRGR